MQYNDMMYDNQQQQQMYGHPDVGFMGGKWFERVWKLTVVSWGCIVSRYFEEAICFELLTDLPIVLFLHTSHKKFPCDSSWEPSQFSILPNNCLLPTIKFARRDHKTKITWSLSAMIYGDTWFWGNPPKTRSWCVMVAENVTNRNRLPRDPFALGANWF